MIRGTMEDLGAVAAVLDGRIQSCGSWNNAKPPICFVWQIQNPF